MIFLEEQMANAQIADKATHISEGFMSAAGIIIALAGLPILILGIFLWRKNKIAYWIAAAIAAINVLSIIAFNVIGASLSVIVLYFLFVDKETKALFR